MHFNTMRPRPITLDWAKRSCSTSKPRWRRCSPYQPRAGASVILRHLLPGSLDTGFSGWVLEPQRLARFLLPRVTKSNACLALRFLLSWR